MEIDASSSTPYTTTPSTTSLTPRWIMWAVIIFAAAVVGTWLFGTPSGVRGKADAVGYAICHRIPDRSFSAYDRQLPLCARCTGIYTGVMTGFLMIVATGRSRASRLPSWRVGIVLGLFIVALGVDGINSYLHLFPDFEGGLYSPHNTLRLITGVFTGLTMIHGLFPIFNASIWEHKDRRRAVDDLKDLGRYALAALVVIGLILTENPLILLVIGLLSAFGVVMVLTMVNSVMFITLIRRERAYNRWSELWLPLLAGLTVAILLIGGIDAARYMVTGTWEGFVFGQG